MTDRASDPEAIFLAAIDKATPQERAAYVEGACAGDPELLRRVRELLDSHDASQGPLDAPPPGLAATMDEPVREAAGTVIGPYKLLQQIGEGGMGTVFMAEQTHPVRRRVALKVIKPGMDTKQVIARFEAERQALAMMDHVNIARVLDAGATQTGRPYFVMELVHGVPITKYCDDNHLTPRERLDLFVPVCHAIQHAHTKGIIHRDVKPSNILVTLYDGKPVPKVIDFGVAKATEQPLTQRTMFTQFGTIVGTLEYMSPEQAEMSGLGVDTRGDIYSLGVLLYELLTGSTPLERPRLRQAAYDEVLRLIREEEAPSPSARLSSSDTLPAIAAARKTEPAKLARLVRGELDWIVLKALEKDRTRRYETASGFAADVQHYLDDEPVEACPPSASYRFRKFARRNKRALLAAGLVFVALVGGFIGTTWGLVRAEQATQSESEQRTIAQDNERKALAAAKAESEQRRQVEQERDRAEKAEVQARASIDRYVDAVQEEELLKDARFQGLRKKLLADALGYYQEFIDTRRHDETAGAELAAAVKRLAMINVDTGSKAEAVHGFQEVVDLLSDLAREQPEQIAYQRSLASELNNLGLSQRAVGDRERALASHRRAIDIQKKLVSQQPEIDSCLSELGSSFNNLGDLQLEMGERDAALASQREALAIRQKLVTKDPRDAQYQCDLASTYNMLGNIGHFRGDNSAALANYERAVAIQERLVDDYASEAEYRRDLAGSCNNLGNLRREMDDLQGAMVSERRSLAIRERLAAENPSVTLDQSALANTHNNLGNVQIAIGDVEGALASFRRALAILERLVTEHPTADAFQISLAGSCCNMGDLLNDKDQPSEALRWLERGKKALESVVGREPRHTLAREFLRNTHATRAGSLTKLGRHAEAAGDWEAAAELDLGPLRSLIRIQRALSLARAGDLKRAAAEAVDLAVAPDLTGENYYDLACVLSLASAAAKSGDTAADERAQRAVELLNRARTARFFANAAIVSRLNEDPNLDALRGRDDFGKLLDEVQRATPSKQ